MQYFNYNLSHMIVFVNIMQAAVTALTVGNSCPLTCYWAMPSDSCRASVIVIEMLELQTIFYLQKILFSLLKLNCSIANIQLCIKRVEEYCLT